MAGLAMRGHVFMAVDALGVTWRTTDGRSGADGHMGPGKYGPTLVGILAGLGLIGPDGVAPGWTIEVHYPGGTRFMLRGPGLALMAQA